MTFNLSLVGKNEQTSEVKASKQTQVKQDSETGKNEQEKVTSGGIPIDKKQAPVLVLDGPLGHYYTELLNATLTNESMGAIVSAAMEDTSDEYQGELGKVSVTPMGPITDALDTGVGYVYVTDSKSITPSNSRDITDKLISMKTKNPNRPVGLAAFVKSEMTPTMESMYRCLSAAGIECRFLPSGFERMVNVMIKGTKP